MKEFRIPQKIPKQPTSTNKSIRFPNDLIDQVEAAMTQRYQEALARYQAAGFFLEE